MTLIDQLARVRQMSGMDPLPDPTQIQGFGPNDPPVPAYVPSPEQPWIEQEEDQAYEPVEPPPSPLIPRRAAPQQPILQPSVPSIVTFNLGVADRRASWKDRFVTLSEPEEKAIRAIVLKAIQRELSDELAEAGVRRVRRSVPGPFHDEPEAVAKKRGRPKKNA